MNLNVRLKGPDMNKASKVPAPIAYAERDTGRAHGLRVLEFLRPMWCHMKHFVVENPGCFLMRLGVLSHFMVSRTDHVVLRSSDASSQEVPQVTKTILMAANSSRTRPSSHFSGIGFGPYPLP